MHLQQNRFPVRQYGETIFHKTVPFLSTKSNKNDSSVFGKSANFENSEISFEICHLLLYQKNIKKAILCLIRVSNLFMASCIDITPKELKGN
jgi:hypothetical protein